MKKTILLIAILSIICVSFIAAEDDPFGLDEDEKQQAKEEGKEVGKITGKAFYAIQRVVGGVIGIIMVLSLAGLGWAAHQHDETKKKNFMIALIVEGVVLMLIYAVPAIMNLFMGINIV